MFTWIRKKCFSNLEQDSQKNNLLLFVIVVSVIAGELNVLIHIPVFSISNVLFLTGIAAVLLVGFALNRSVKLVPHFKYIMMFIMSGFSALQLFIFNEYPAVFQVIYFTLALTLIYLNVRLIIFVGGIIIVFTFFGHLFWRDLFFRWSDISLVNISLGVMAETTLVLWAATRIGTSYYLVFDSNQKMKQLLKENQEQFDLIGKQNKILEEYAKQVEQLTLREERQRMAKELHDTVGHTVTSLILGMETTKNLIESDTEGAKEKLDNLIRTAQDGLSEIRENVYQSSFEDKSVKLSDQFIQITDNFCRNTGTTIDFSISGEEVELIQQLHFILTRCLQECLTNALRHGKATRIEITLVYKQNRVKLLIKDNGIGFDHIKYGFGLTAMSERVQALDGELDITSMAGTGAAVVVSLPLKPAKAHEKIRVLIVDDKEFIRESFTILLSTDNIMTVVGTAQNGYEALELCEKLNPDVILMDIHMPDLDGVETTKRIKETWPNIKVIILTTFGEIQFAVDAINAGAEGYLLKSNHPKNIANAVRLVFKGGNLISQEMAKMLVSDLQKEVNPKTSSSTVTLNAHSLKERELQILRCLTQGLRYKEISAKLNLSEGTVRNYISSIYSKLEVSGREEATKIAKEKGII